MDNSSDKISEVHTDAAAESSSLIGHEVYDDQGRLVDFIPATPPVHKGCADCGCGGCVDPEDE